MKIEVDYKAIIEISDKETELIEVVHSRMNDEFKDELKNEIDDIFTLDSGFESSFDIKIIEG